MKDFDYILLFSVLVLVAFGIFSIFTATHGSNIEDKYVKQSIYLGISILIGIIVYFVPLRMHYVLAYFYYAGIILILIFLILKNSQVERWINIGPFQFQPSEISKLVAVFVLSRFLYDQKREVNSIKTIIGAGLIILIPFGLVLKQPDLGTAMVFSIIYITLLFRAGVRPLYIFIILSPFLSIVTAVHWISWALYFVIFLLILFFSEPGIKLFTFATALNLIVGLSTPMYWNSLHDYQKNRILVFLDPGRDPFGGAYQLIQSKIAVGSGGLWGKGFLQGTQTNLAFLPIRHSDFIFSVIAEQFGFVACFMILAFFFIIIWRILKASEDANNLFYQMVAFGIMSIILFQVVVNIGMTIGLAPITGLPLPFLSYGGTSLLANIIAIALVLNVRKNRQEY